VTVTGFVALLGMGKVYDIVIVLASVGRGRSMMFRAEAQRARRVAKRGQLIRCPRLCGRQGATLTRDLVKIEYCHYASRIR
jgi:hypothetical protein